MSDRSRRSRSGERDYNGDNRSRRRSRSRECEYKDNRSRRQSQSREYDTDNRYNNRESNDKESNKDNTSKRSHSREDRNREYKYDDDKNNKSKDNNSSSLYEQMNSIMSKSERRDKDSLIIDSSKVIWGKNDNLLKEGNNNNNNEEDSLKFKADFGLSGALAKDEKTGNTVNGVVLKFTEPIDAAIPKELWRFYVFKGDEIIETLFLHRKSSYLLGRDDRVADLLITHPSCSKQHAVLQFRSQEVRTSTGNIREIKPYIMDLGSVHKTFLNNVAIEDARYYELKNKDMLKFGSSTREYVLIIDK